MLFLSPEKKTYSRNLSWSGCSSNVEVSVIIGMRPLGRLSGRTNIFSQARLVRVHVCFPTCPLNRSITGATHFFQHAFICYVHSFAHCGEAVSVGQTHWLYNKVNVAHSFKKEAKWGVTAPCILMFGLLGPTKRLLKKMKIAIKSAI